ncbi:twin-arginine translocation signal domain-containing protein [Streptomyces sparsogenes]|uniref:Secreted protein n=1 Tax=Streptomyces sparsogenes DSM 40356 TaxID=1331668 RepID=A0A1R1S748_9ACTN|nr:twin-arginine translocation signal domain-containing protein [Streptomyces sparsogenes]OMI34136.1 hypothetical protein SPAR_38140 [Streptomyces sparsogenes DSM 40356]
MPLHRRHFLAGTAAVGGLLAAAPESVAAPASATRPGHGLPKEPDKDFLVVLTKAADGRVAEVLAGRAAAIAELRDQGKARAAAACACWPRCTAPFNYRLTLR